MKFFQKINQFLINLSVSKFILIITVCMFLCSLLLGVFLEALGIISSGSESSISQNSLQVQFVAAVILAPLLETLVFQKWVIKILRKITIFKQNDLPIILISAFLFGLQHYYNWGYILHMAFIGIFLSYAYVTYEKKAQSAFGVVCIIHGLKNFISFLLTCA